MIIFPFRNHQRFRTILQAPCTRNLLSLGEYGAISREVLVLAYFYTLYYIILYYIILYYIILYYIMSYYIISYYITSLLLELAEMEFWPAFFYSGPLCTGTSHEFEDVMVKSD